MDIKVEMEFICPECNTIIEHDYTDKDILNESHLDLTCQKCGYQEQVKTSVLIEKAKKKVIKDIEKSFK
ncbi:MAG: hypothetical protein K0S61_4547 [Anaerocolumna sp.]|nr:hypothetical protein [Anaerocolumna sp.]